LASLAAAAKACLRCSPLSPCMHPSPDYNNDNDNDKNNNNNSYDGDDDYHDAYNECKVNDKDNESDDDHAWAEPESIKHAMLVKFLQTALF